MAKRAVKGTRDWKRYEVVLDVSESAEEIAFGILLSGKGQVWTDDLKFEVVGKEIATTGESTNTEVSKQPANLNFEE
jgi:hypothetical protein